MSEESEYPPISEQAKSVAGSAFKIFKGLFNGETVFASLETQVERKKICEGCEFYDKDCDPLPRCKKCGCVVDFKVPIAFEKCPIDKWGMDEEGFIQHFNKQLDEDQKTLQTTLCLGWR